MFHIGILTYSEAQAAAVLGMTDLFEAADAAARLSDPDQGLIVSHWRKSSPEGRMTKVFSTADTTSCPDICILPPSLKGPPVPDTITSEWLRARHSDGAVLASVCTGAFVLGAAGLLDGRAVTTHWTYEERFRREFPLARIDTDPLVIDEGDIITAGGVMSWTDLVLTVIERYLGSAVMNEVARGFLIDPPGRRQSYYSSFQPYLDHADGPIRSAQDFLQDHLAEEISLARLSSVSGLEQRTFLRRFQKATGLTATDYRQRLRIARSQELLRTTRVKAEQIGWQVGYVDPSAFRKTFNRIVGLSPSEYRKRFSSRSPIPPSPLPQLKGRAG